MEVASSRPDHLPTLSAAITSKLSLLVKSPFGGGAVDAGNATPTFCFSVPAILKLTTLIIIIIIMVIFKCYFSGELIALS